MTVILVLLFTVNVAVVVAPKLTEVAPVSRLPVIVTIVPPAADPLVGVSLVISGGFGASAADGLGDASMPSTAISAANRSAIHRDVVREGCRMSSPSPSVRLPSVRFGNLTDECLARRSVLVARLVATGRWRSDRSCRR